MIKVELIKFDPFTNKPQTKTWNCASEERARSKAEAFATVNGIHSSQISDEWDDRGVLTKIVISARTPAPPTSPTERSLTSTENPLGVAGTDAASENEECARLTEKILGKGNNVALLIRARMGQSA